jgi:hypothetical protein
MEHDISYPGLHLLVCRYSIKQLSASTQPSGKISFCHAVVTGGM